MPVDADEMQHLIDMEWWRSLAKQWRIAEQTEDRQAWLGCWISCHLRRCSVVAIIEECTPVLRTVVNDNEPHIETEKSLYSFDDLCAKPGSIPTLAQIEQAKELIRQSWSHEEVVRRSHGIAEDDTDAAID